MEKVQSNLIGEILVKSGHLTQKQLERVLLLQKKEQKRLGDLLVEMGLVKESDIMEAYSKQLNVPFHANLDELEPDRVALRIIPVDMAKRYITLALSLHETYIPAAVADPTDNTLSTTIEFATGRRLRYVLSTPTAIIKAINKFYNGIETDNIGDILVSESVINKDQLLEALGEQELSGKKLGKILIEKGFATERHIANAFSKQFSIPLTDLKVTTPHQDALSLIPSGLAERHSIIPVTLENGVLTIAMADPLDVKTINAISVATGKFVRATVSGESEIKEAIKTYYNGQQSERLGEIAVSAAFSTEVVKDKAKPVKGKTIKDILLSTGMLTQKKLAELTEKGKDLSIHLTEMIVSEELVTEEQIAKALAEIYGTHYVDLSDLKIPPQVIGLISENIATKYMVLPVALEGRIITVAMSNPSDIDAIDAIQFATGKKVKIVVTTPLEILKAIHIYYRGGKAARIGDILVDMGVLSKEQLEQCLIKQKECKKKIGQIFLEEKIIKEDDLYRAFAIQLGIPYMDLNNITIDPDVLKLLPEDLIRNSLVLPLSLEKQTLTVVAYNPFNVELITNIRRISGKNLNVVMSSPVKLRNAIKKAFEPPDDLDALQDITENLEFLDTTPADAKDEVNIKEAEAAPIVRITDSLLIYALQTGASDIHLEPRQKVMVVRNRIDGFLKEVKHLPIKVHKAVVSRIKIMADMDISQRRLPQDGIKKVLQGHTDMNQIYHVCMI